MILTHGANSLPRGSSDPDIIGGRKYRTVTIGNQTWLAENLDFKFPGLVVGTSGTSTDEPRGNYYNNDESTYGVNGNKYGLLYNWYAVKYLNDHRAELIPGWHVPSFDEWIALANVVGGTSTAGTKLKSTTGWSSGAGTDNYGFSVFPAGYLTGSFGGINSMSYFLTTTERESDVLATNFYSGASMGGFRANRGSQYSVRLVKDA